MSSCQMNLRQTNVQPTCILNVFKHTTNCESPLYLCLVCYQQLVSYSCIYRNIVQFIVSRLLMVVLLQFQFLSRLIFIYSLFLFLSAVQGGNNQALVASTVQLYDGRNIDGRSYRVEKKVNFVQKTRKTQNQKNLQVSIHHSQHPSLPLYMLADGLRLFLMTHINDVHCTCGSVCNYSWI